MDFDIFDKQNGKMSIFLISKKKWMARYNSLFIYVCICIYIYLFAARGCVGMWPRIINQMIRMSKVSSLAARFFLTACSLGQNIKFRHKSVDDFERCGAAVTRRPKHNVGWGEGEGGW